MTARTLELPARALAVGRRFRRGDLMLYILLIPAAVATLMPIAYMLSQSLTPEADTLAWPIQWIPKNPTLNNFERLFNDPTLPVFRWLVNSVLVSLAVTALVLLIDSLTAYAFARLRFPGRDFIFFVLLISLMIPGHITLIPTFLLMRNLNFLDTYHALIWNHGAGVFGIFLLRQYFLSIPRELEEAAIVDGAGRLRLYWQIAVPLVSSALVALGIFTFLGSWNDLFWPLIVLSDRQQLTLPVGLAILGQGYYTQRSLTMAAAVVASFPVLLLYAVFQRRIIAGVSLTGLAGR